MGTCAYCGKEYPPPHGRPSRLIMRQYCSPRCSIYARREQTNKNKKVIAEQPYCYCDGCNGEEYHYKGLRSAR